jgi:hypothetical protein
MFNHSHRMRAHYTHAFSVIFLSQAAYVANRRHAFAIARASNLPAAKWERDHGKRDDRRGENREPVSGGVMPSADCRMGFGDGLITLYLRTRFACGACIGSVLK